MNFHIGLSLLILFQIVVDLILIVAFILFYRRLRLLNPKKLDQLILLLRENEAMVEGVLSQPPEKGEQKADSVIQMFQQGMDMAEISNTLGISEAEVELIIQKASKGKPQ